MNKNIKPNNKKVRLSNIEQALTNSDSNSSSQIPVAGQHKSIGQIIFSKKLYQSHALEIAEEYEQALEDNSLEKIKILLDKVLEIDRPRK